MNFIADHSVLLLFLPVRLWLTVIRLNDDDDCKFTLNFISKPSSSFSCSFFWNQKKTRLYLRTFVCKNSTCISISHFRNMLNCLSIFLQWIANNCSILIFSFVVDVKCTYQSVSLFFLVLHRLRVRRTSRKNY